MEVTGFFSYEFLSQLTGIAIGAAVALFLIGIVVFVIYRRVKQSSKYSATLSILKGVFSVCYPQYFRNVTWWILCQFTIIARCYGSSFPGKEL